jgi:hypothetical protein
MSAGIEGPFAIILSDDPGIERHERRGRSRDRADINEMLDAVDDQPPALRQSTSLAV